MLKELEKLPDDATALKELVLSLRASLAEQEQHYRSQIKQLEEKIRFYRDRLFGRKSEKHDPEEDRQRSLFDEAEVAAAENSPQDVEPPQTEVAAHKRRKPKRSNLPPDLPRKEVVVDIPGEDKICGCGCRMEPFGEEVTEKLEIIPAQVNVIRYIRPKYVCKACEGVETEGPTVKIAPLPPQLIPKGFATARLVAYLGSPQKV